MRRDGGSGRAAGVRRSWDALASVRPERGLLRPPAGAALLPSLPLSEVRGGRCPGARQVPAGGDLAQCHGAAEGEEELGRALCSPGMPSPAAGRGQSRRSRLSPPARSAPPGKLGGRGAGRAAGSGAAGSGGGRGGCGFPRGARPPGRRGFIGVSRSVCRLFPEEIKRDSN